MPDGSSLNSLADTALKRIASLDPFPEPPIIPLRYPVVLMHGFGMLAGMRRGGHLHDEAVFLRSRGVRAYAPNVAPYNTVHVRAQMWLDRIERVLEETRSDRVHIIAHSMGGLDARFLVSKMEMDRQVATVTTVSTPHRGTAVAEYILSRPERVRDWLTEFANWMGSQVVEDGDSDFSTAVRQLTPEYMLNEFNPNVPDHPDVAYFSYAGIAGKGTPVAINPFLRLLNSVLYDAEGQNDGMVSVRSAKWGSFEGSIEADHALQVGLYFIKGSSFNTHDFYLDIARNLSDRDG